jgi:hydroxypyruvate isomerase
MFRDILAQMPRLAANVSTLFKELPFLERFAAAARAGFRAVEYQYPYEWPAQDVAAAARAAGLEVVLHNMPRGDPQVGEHGTACLPGREQRFRDDLELALEYARLAGCKRMHCMAGVAPAGLERSVLHRTYVANLRYAGERLRKEGMRVLIEPLSAGTVAGCFLTGSSQAVQVIEEVALDNVALQYDFFHMQTMEGNLAASVERMLPRIGHFQLADVPGRHEPGTGEINFDFLLRHVDRIGYSGWIGCEYNPAGDTVEGLKWAKPYL